MSLKRAYRYRLTISDHPAVKPTAISFPTVAEALAAMDRLIDSQSGSLFAPGGPGRMKITEVAL